MLPVVSRILWICWIQWKFCSIQGKPPLFEDPWRTESEDFYLLFLHWIQETFYCGWEAMKNRCQSSWSFLLELVEGLVGEGEFFSAVGDRRNSVSDPGRRKHWMCWLCELHRTPPRYVWSLVQNLWGKVGSFFLKYYFSHYFSMSAIWSQIFSRR